MLSFFEKDKTYRTKKVLAHWGVAYYHFIEVDVDEAGNQYLVIHTGSRNLGKQVAEIYQNLAYDILRGKDTLLEEKKESD